MRPPAERHVGARWRKGLPGLLLLALAHLPLGSGGGAVAASGEPLALALAPLGPVRALVSSALWVELFRSQRGVDADRVTSLARALLELHPDLVVVREYLANQLMVTEARRAPDRARHDALVQAGLGMFEEGLARDGARLKSLLAFTLAEQARIDVRFAAAAERWFGETAEDVAIELLEGSADPVDAGTRAQLLVERGLARLIGARDEAAARRDLAEAERCLQPVGAQQAAAADDILHPLKEALAQPRPSLPAEWPSADEEP